MSIFEKALGPEHPYVAYSLNNLALIYYHKGDYAQAEPLYTRALAIFEKALGPDHPNVAHTLNCMALLYKDKGDLARAEPLYARSLAISEKVLGADHQEVAYSLNNLAVVCTARDDFSQAEPLLVRALAIYQKALGPDHQSVAYTFNNLAQLYDAKGDFARAESLYLQATTIYEKALSSDHPNVASCLNNLALLYKKKGEYARAEPLLMRSATIREKALGLNHPDVAQSLTGLASLFLVKGDINQAVRYQSRGNEVSEQDLVRNLISGSERQKLLYLNQTAKNTDITLSINIQSAPQNPESRQAALTVILRRKGRALDALTSEIETLRRQQDPQTQKLLGDYAKLVGQISVLTLRGPDKKNLETHLASLHLLEIEKEKLENEIGQRSKEFQVQTVPITVAEVQKHIPPDTVLVEYAVYQPYDAKTDQFGNARYVVYVLDHNGTINFADLGETEPIDQLVTRLRQDLSHPKAAKSRQVRLVSQ
ncbi:MAG TPA: tetratricopeptide repeat protein, partial [Acidobacteriota bacterium]|nr:tetratricopeptide repeat protein [Acidobacteriota bacterium]